MARFIRAVIQGVTHAQEFETVNEAKAYVLERCPQGHSANDFFAEVSVEDSDDSPPSSPAVFATMRPLFIARHIFDSVTKTWRQVQ